MDENRLLRAIVTALTLAASLWILHNITANRTSLALDAESAAVIEAVPSANSTEIANLPPVTVAELPLVALDNTCERSDEADLSACTGMLSGGPVRVYDVEVAEGEALYITAAPRHTDYDISFVVQDRQGRCVSGRDAEGAGRLEALRTPPLAAGAYRLVVGGYSNNCGRYELTIRNEAAPMAQVENASVHPAQNGNVIRWQTFAEVEVNHYELYRCLGEMRERIASMRQHGSPAGYANYRYVDHQTEPGVRYEIEAVAKDGRREVVTAG